MRYYGTSPVFPMVWMASSASYDIAVIKKTELTKKAETRSPARRSTMKPSARQTRPIQHHSCPRRRVTGGTVARQTTSHHFIPYFTPNILLLLWFLYHYCFCFCHFSFRVVTLFVSFCISCQIKKIFPFFHHLTLLHFLDIFFDHVNEVIPSALSIISDLEKSMLNVHTH